MLPLPVTFSTRAHTHTHIHTHSQSYKLLKSCPVCQKKMWMKKCAFVSTGIARQTCLRFVTYKCTVAICAHACYMLKHRDMNTVTNVCRTQRLLTAGVLGRVETIITAKKRPPVPLSSETGDIDIICVQKCWRGMIWTRLQMNLYEPVWSFLDVPSPSDAVKNLWENCESHC